MTIDAPYPAAASFSRSDWTLLAGYWHAVAQSAEVTAAAPVGVTLLDVRLVLYRLDGRLTAAVDHCPHRGTRLSLGAIRGGRLVCRYHGLEFDGSGICTRIPGDPHSKRPSELLRVATVMVEERYGLVWVCLSGRPAAPIPDWTLLEQSGNQRGCVHEVWNCSAARHLENFCDIAHFPFAHAATFGCAGRPQTPPYTLETRLHGWYFAPDIWMLDSSAGESEAAYTTVRSEYEVTAPFAARLTLHYGKGIEHICDTASPLSATQTRVFILKSRDHDQHQPLAQWLEFQQAVNDEDRTMVESQTPLLLPLTRGVERDLASDRFSVAYRKYWIDVGLGAGGPD